jgi:DNA-binding MarR family transcriptional regulator/ribosomal protein S18 acetylase RimI-like enzyme
MLDAIARLRRFNRAVTKEVGALDSSYLGRGRPLGAARVLQLVRPEGSDIAMIRARLGLDSGLLSRLLRGLEDEGLVTLDTDAGDRRRRIARLTAAGQAEMAQYEALGLARAQQIFARAGSRQGDVIAAMDLIATVMLQDQVEIRAADPDSPEALACLQAYYALLCARIEAVTPDLLTLPLSDSPNYRPPLGAFLLAWSDDLPIGCVSLRPLGPGVAEVKRLWVDPQARGQGLGRRLMRAIESEARALGYRELKLDSNTALGEAIALYRGDGWRDIPKYSGFPSNLWLGKRL